jgi:hypothetical protein
MSSFTLFHTVIKITDVQIKHPCLRYKDVVEAVVEAVLEILCEFRL